jgi:hypothetical protein
MVRDYLPVASIGAIGSQHRAVAQLIQRLAAVTSTSIILAAAKPGTIAASAGNTLEISHHLLSFRAVAFVALCAYSSLPGRAAKITHSRARHY